MAGEHRFVPFPTYEDNTNQIISADQINAVDSEVQLNESNIFSLKKSQFIDKCLFLLENHAVANAFWMDSFVDESKVDLTQAAGLLYDTGMSAWRFDDTTGATQATLVSLPYTPDTGSSVQQVILMTSDYTPPETVISYFIANDGVTFFPISPNQSTTIQLATGGSTLVIKAIIQRVSATTISPVIYSWGVLYSDITNIPYIPDTMPNSTPFATQALSHWNLTDVEPDQHHPRIHAHSTEDGSGLVSHDVLTNITPDDHHPMLHHHSGAIGQNTKVSLQAEVEGVLPLRNLPIVLSTGFPGETILYRDTTGQLTRASGPDADVFLLYGNDGSLSRVVSQIGPNATDEYLDYVSDGQGGTILNDVRKYVKDLQAVDILALIGNQPLDLTTNSAWTIPYNTPTSPYTPDAPSNFNYTQVTPGSPTFTWDAITDPQIDGVIIYYSISAGVWQNFTYVIPASATEYPNNFILDPGTYTFSIVSVSQDGVVSAMAINNTPLVVGGTII